jgi:hypothetical protein
MPRKRLITLETYSFGYLFYNQPAYEKNQKKCVYFTHYKRNLKIKNKKSESHPIHLFK